MTTGTIKKVVADRGFGFITAEDAKEYFFHRGGLDSSLDFDRLVGGEKVAVRDRAEPQGPAREPGAIRLASRPAAPAGRPQRGRSAFVISRHLFRSGLRRQPPRRSSGARLTTPKRNLAIVRTAFVSTYPPRHCGIAAFASDLAANTSDREVVALHLPEQPTSMYPIEVHHRIRRDEPDDYLRTAEALRRCVGVVSIQHEYGIWGGEDGTRVLDFVRALRVPSVTTLHTVLQHPTPGQRAVLSELVARTEATVVMSRSAASLLTSASVSTEAVCHVIPHGVPELPFVDPVTVKPALGLEGRKVILSFGLLGPGKGYELALAALPDVVAAHPSVLYVVVGATHPDLLRSQGEAYREGLVGTVARLGIEDHVQIRRSVRRAGRAEEMAGGGRRLRHALSQPRSDRVRDHVLRDGRRPRHRVHSIRIRD